MKPKLTPKLTLATVSFLSLATQRAAAEAFAPGENLNLTCSGKAYVINQPCHGYNTRSMQLAIAAKNGSYSEDRNYGGCYPMGDHQYGHLSNFQRSSRNSSIITFDFLPAEASEGIMRGQLNLKTLILKLDTREISNFYQQPNVLNCIKSK